MKYYSETLNEFYNTAAECEKAEYEYERKARVKAAENLMTEVKAAYEVMKAAEKTYLDSKAEYDKKMRAYSEAVSPSHIHPNPDSTKVNVTIKDKDGVKAYTGADAVKAFDDAIRKIDWKKFNLEDLAASLGIL